MNFSGLRGLLALPVWLAVLGAPTPRVSAQAAENPRLVPAPHPAGAWTLQWDGRPGRTYFVQQSHDLRRWTYLETIRHGEGVKMHAVFSTGEKYFLRLRHSDIPCDDPALADFDNDGLANAAELSLSTDPFNADSDGDGFKDGWETLAGWNPASDDSARRHADDDGDGLDNLGEHESDSLPGAVDSDADGIADAADAAPMDPAVNWTRAREPVFAAIPIPAASPPAAETGPPAPDYGAVLSCNALGQVLAERALWRDGEWVPLRQAMAPVAYSLLREPPGVSEQMVMQMVPGSGRAWAVDDFGGVLGTAHFPQTAPQETPWGELAVYWPAPDTDPVLVGFPQPGDTITAAQIPYWSEPAALSPDGWILLEKSHDADWQRRIEFFARSSPHQTAGSHPGLVIGLPWSHGTEVPWHGPGWISLVARGATDGGLVCGVDFTGGSPVALRWFAPQTGSATGAKTFSSSQALRGWSAGRVGAGAHLLAELTQQGRLTTHRFLNNAWQEVSSLRGSAFVRADGVALSADSTRLWRNARWQDLRRLVPDSPLAAGELYRARAFPEGGLILATRDDDNALYEQGPANLLFPVELVARDRFFAGSLRIPEGWDDLELSFHNTANGEDYGQWGDLISSGGNTLIHANLTDILAENGTVQSEDQKVWFVRDPTDHRRLYFYTCFEAHGRAELRLHRGGQLLGKVSRDLVFEPIMDRWIRGVDAWVDGRAFGLVPPPASGGFFVSTGNEQPSGLPEGGSSIFDLPADGKLDHLTRALLVPVFTAITGVKGAEALFRGIIDGIRSGLNDDWEFILAIKNGAVLAGNFAWQAAETEIQRWRADPLTRSRELMAAIIQGVDDHIVQPLAEQAPAMGIGSWFTLHQHMWAYSVRVSQKIADGAAATWNWAVNAPQKLAASLTGWMDNLAGRMGQQAEQFIWTNSPWKTDPLFAGAEAGIVTAWYSIGYCSGYISEQIVIGIVTGGVGKIAVVLAKAGGQAAFQLAKRTVTQVWARIHAMKNCLAMEVVEAGTGIRLNVMLNDALSTSGKKAIAENANLRESALEALEALMKRHGFDRAKFNHKAVVDHLMFREKGKAMLNNPATRAVLFDRLAVLGKLLDNDVEGKFMKNFLDFAEDRLIVLKDDGAFELEWMDDWMRAFKANPSEFVNRPALESITPDQRVYLKHILDDSPGVPGKPGDFWRLDDPPWENIDQNSPHWERYRIRGILGELHRYHEKYLGEGYIHTPTAKATDFTKDIAVQVKCTINPMGAASRAKKAIDDLYDARPTGPLRLEVLVKPGVDWSDLDAALAAHLEIAYTPAQQARIQIVIMNYSAVL